MAGRMRADVACPQCGPLCRTPANRTRPVLRLWRLGEVGISFICQRCGARGYALDFQARRSTDDTEWKRRVTEARRAEKQERQRKRRIVDWLWQQSAPVAGTLGETYLRKHRGIACPLPPAMRFIGAGKHPAAILMPFRDQAGALKGLHLTSLNPDGSKIEKKMLGADTVGCPLVCAEPGGSHLAITEGIEDALSLFQAVGVATWAAGSAGRMPALAERLPTWATEITIVADSDLPGRNGANELKRRVMKMRRAVVILQLEAS
ncbi:toprim domain-containing protein [Sinorhizobium meliloti]|uniref:toprim domain-containing protein n=1 Tax=Rhizobium meliloti TaxID=382 RepID=UPI000FD8F7C9|nr:toprim domain-containing protein [Sinorhizobium meliloti]RVG08619.1 toprim domain-containing protein [Sinorhizobium meliloti]